LNDDAILDKANELLEEFKPQFPRCEATTKVTDTKMPRKTVKEIVSFGIGEQQYPAFVKTETYKQLVALAGALNLLAPKWKMQIKPYQNERDLTLGFYDYLDDKYHPSRLAGETLKAIFITLANLTHRPLFVLVQLKIISLKSCV
jgi:hypothetical protein